MRPSTTNTQPACLTPGQTPNPSFIDVSWAASSNNTNYAVYKFQRTGTDGPVVAVNPDNPIILASSQTSYHDTDVLPGYSYNYAVLAINTTFGTYTWANNAPQITPPTTDPYSPSIQVPAIPPSCTPPTITSILIDQGSTTTTFNGASRTSGLLSGESGSNWRNSIFVTLNAQQGSSALKEYYVTFQNGPKLAYTDSPASNNICGSDADSNYCVFDNGWKPVRLIGYSVPTTCIGEDCQYVIVPRSGTANTANWEVFFHKNFGDKTMSISGYVKDANGLCSNNSCQDSDLNALQQP